MTTIFDTPLDNASESGSANAEEKAVDEAFKEILISLHDFFPHTVPIEWQLQLKAVLAEVYNTSHEPLKIQDGETAISQLKRIARMFGYEGAIRLDPLGVAWCAERHSSKLPEAKNLEDLISIALRTRNEVLEEVAVWIEKNFSATSLTSSVRNMKTK